MRALTADDDLEGGGAAGSLGVLGVLEERTGDHRSTSRSHAVVVQLEDLEAGVAGDELEPAWTEEKRATQRSVAASGVGSRALPFKVTRARAETYMGSAERPPKALSDKSSETRLGRWRSEVHRKRSESGISLISRPVKMSEKSATCACTAVSVQTSCEAGNLGVLYLEVVLVGDCICDALAGLNSERVATETDLLQIVNLTKLGQVGLD